MSSLTMNSVDTKFLNSKVPIHTLPVELRIKIYEMWTSSRYYDGYLHVFYENTPWTRTVFMSGALNDKDALEIVAIQSDETRNKICELLALSGNLPALQWARSGRTFYYTSSEHADKMGRKIPIPWDSMTCANAAEGGHFHLLKWAYDHGCPWDDRTFSNAARWGNLKVLQWLYDQKCPWDDETTIAAADADDDMKIVKWLHEKNCPLHPQLWDEPVQFDDREKLKWLSEINCPCNESSLCELAAYHQNFELMCWLYEQGHGLTEEVHSEAAKHAEIEIFEWLHERDCPYNESTFASAAGYNKLDILRWLYDHDFPWDESCCASTCNYFLINWDNLKWLRAHGCPWDSDTFIFACRHSDDLDILQWLYENNCPWDEFVSTMACYLGKWDFLKWLVEHGCPWDTRVTHHALKNGNREIFDWAISCGCPYDATFINDVSLYPYLY